MVNIIRSADHAALLQRGAATALLEGRLVLIGLDSIKDRSGSRWPSRSETVRAYAERQFAKEFGPEDQLLALDDINYMIIKADESGAIVTGRAVNFLRGILNFFLGESRFADVRVSRVTDIKDGVVESESFTTQELKQFVDRQSDLMSRPAEHSELPDGKKFASSKFSRGYDVRCLSEPIWSVRKGAMVACRLRATVFERDKEKPLNIKDLAASAPLDIIGIDLMVLEDALGFLASAMPNEKTGLHVPIHFSTVNSSAGRRAIVARLSAMPRSMLEKLIICLVGLEAGVPRVALDAAVAMLAPFTLGVVGQASHQGINVENWKGTRIAAVALDMQMLQSSELAGLPQSLPRFCENAERVCGARFAYGVSTRAEALAAWAAGFTDVSGELFNVDQSPAFRPRRFAALNLYSGFDIAPPSSSGNLSAGLA